MTFDYDLLVIGAGSGGVRTARRASEYGARVAIVEQNALGGTCVNAGCIPKKLMIYAAEYADSLAEAAAYGWQLAKADFHWQTLRDNVQKEIQRINSAYQQILAKAEVTLLRGQAKLIAPHQIELNGQILKARHIVIATGAKAFMPPITGIEHAVSSDKVFSLEQLPEKLIIIGGGYIAAEFAGLFQRLGCEVSIIAKSERLLMGFDQDCAEHTANYMQNAGTQMRFDQTAESIVKQADGRLSVKTDDGSNLNADMVLVAAGRKANLQALDCEPAGLHCNEDGYLAVDRHFATTLDSVYALGDVTGGMQLTPVAIAEGEALAAYLFADELPEIDTNLVPTTVFANPPVAKIGLTEQQAKAQGLKINVFSKTFNGLKAQLSGVQKRNFLKLIVDCSNDKVIGAHMSGENAGEIMQGIAIAMQAGAKKADFDRTIGIHPTAAEEFVSLRQNESEKS